MFKKNSNIDIVFNIAESQLSVWLEHQWDIFKLLGSYHILVHKVDMGRPIVR